MESGRTIHGVTSQLMRNRRANCRSVETLAYISCQAIDHMPLRYRHALPLPTASEIPRAVPYLQRRWLRSASPVVADLQAGPPTESYMAHNYTGQLAIPASVDWSNKYLVITPRNSRCWLASLARWWVPSPLPVPASVDPACFSMTVVRCRKR